MCTCLIKLTLGLIQKKFVAACLKFADTPAVNITKNFTSRCQSLRDSWQDHAEIFATVNLLLGENLGKICCRILAKFCPPGLLLPGENLGELRGRIVQRFWQPEFLLLLMVSKMVVWWGAVVQNLMISEI